MGGHDGVRSPQMIRRTTDATALNLVANHPDVRPYLGHPESPDPLDLTPLVENPANITIEADGGGWLLQAILPAVYELHTLFLPEARGKPYFRQAREAMRLVFTTTDALEILTKCPDDNPGARMAATLAGFRERFRREHVWNIGTTAECGVSYQAFTIDDWIARDGEIKRVGHEFHETLETEKRARGSELAVHPDDEAHDRAVGAAYLMAKHGQMAKGVGVYNRWAAFAGYVAVRMLSPSILDIADAVLEVSDGEMKVLGVR